MTILENLLDEYKSNLKNSKQSRRYDEESAAYHDGQESVLESIIESLKWAVEEENRLSQ